MAWILDEYSKFHGYSPAVVTGKPIVSMKIYVVVSNVVVRFVHIKLETKKDNI